jgi:hypothetical protein
MKTTTKNSNPKHWQTSLEKVTGCQLTSSGILASEGRRMERDAVTNHGS